MPAVRCEDRVLVAGELGDDFAACRLPDTDGGAVPIGRELAAGQVTAAVRGERGTVEAHPRPVDPPYLADLLRRGRYARLLAARLAIEHGSYFQRVLDPARF